MTDRAREVETPTPPTTTNEDAVLRTPRSTADWKQEKAKARVRQFMNILEQLPRLCSPTICGTLSQPTTRNERATRGVDQFEWSLEQKAILSPANITTDTEATDEWQNVADLNQTWLQQESDVFFSQRTIAPSPMATPSYVNIDETSDEEFDDTRTNIDMTHLDDDNDNDNDIDDDDLDLDQDHERDLDNESELFFSPQPLTSSQTQQRVDMFSPETFVRVMEDESTIQSTPKTIGSQLTRTRTRTRNDEMYD